MYPKIKFKIDINKDIRTLEAFVNDAQFDGGQNLQWAIFKNYPNLKEYFKENKIKDFQKIAEFVKEKYKKEEKIIQKNIKIYQANWKKVENSFFDLTDALFIDQSWPKGKYIAYPTIWSMFPRFLEDKTFQVPYAYKKEKYVNVVIAHEMLHFIFYEYLYKKYPKYKKDKYNFLVWNISEIFNEVVQNSPKWKKVFGLKSMGYSHHKKIVEKISKKYHKNEKINADLLIGDIFAEVETIKKNKS